MKRSDEGLKPVTTDRRKIVAGAVAAAILALARPIWARPKTNGMEGLVMKRNEDTVVALLGLIDASTPDLDRIIGFFTEDAHYHPNCPVGELANGREAVRKELARQFARYKDCHCEIHCMAADATHVFTERTDSVTMRASNARVSVPLCAVFDIAADGKIRGWREYYDVREALRQMPGAHA